MKVDAGAAYPFATGRNREPAPADTQAFAAMLSPGQARTDDGASGAARNSGPDFTGMTRQDLFDWMNGQIRNGDMSLDEGSAYMGITMKISAATGQPVDMTTDTDRIDFIDKARQGLAFFQESFDFASAERMQEAINRMERASAGGV